MNPHLIFQVGQNPPRGVQIPKKPPIQTYIIFAVMSKLIKRKENFPHTEYKEIQNGAVAKSYKTKAVNRGHKRTRRVRDRDFVKFERSRRYRDRYRCQEKKSRCGRARDLVFRDPPTPRTSPRSLFADRDPPPHSYRHLHNNNNIVALIHTTAVATFTATTIL